MICPRVSQGIAYCATSVCAILLISERVNLPFCFSADYITLPLPFFSFLKGPSGVDINRRCFFFSFWQKSRVEAVKKS